MAAVCRMPSRTRRACEVIVHSLTPRRGRADSEHHRPVQGGPAARSDHEHTVHVARCWQGARPVPPASSSTAAGSVHALPPVGPDARSRRRSRSTAARSSCRPRCRRRRWARWTATSSGCAGCASRCCPPGCPATTVWGYGSETTHGTYNAPSLTIEARVGPPGRGDLGERPGRRQDRPLPAAPAAGGPDAALGEPGRRRGRPRRARRCSRDARALPRAGADAWRTCTAATPTRRATATREAWFLPDSRDIPDGYARVGSTYDVDVRAVRRPARRPAWAARDRPGALRQRPGGRDAVVPRPRARHHPAERLRRPGRVLPPARRRPRPRAPACCPARRARRGGPRDPARHPGPGVPPRRRACSTPTPASTSTGSPGPTCPTRTSRRSGTRSSSATR